jgi:hypothetical protein
MSNEPKKYHIRAGLYVLRDTNATAILKIEEDNDGMWMFCEDYEKLKKQLEWQPIETAPKDGTYLLLNTRYSEIVIGWFGKDLNIENYNGWLYGDGDGYSTGYYYNPINPTHWMPLPKPPQN